MGKGFPFETPHPSSVSANETDTPNISSGSPVTVLTAPAIKGGDVPKIVQATMPISASGSDETITYDCLRDGSTSLGTYTHTVPDGTTMLASPHWYDSAPGKGEPVYTVTAQSTSGDGQAESGRRITVHNA
jgi:hypothetical protein